MDVQCECFMVYICGIIFTKPAIRQAFLSKAHYFNRIMGIILALLAFYVVYEIFIN